MCRLHQIVFRVSSWIKDIETSDSDGESCVRNDSASRVVETETSGNSIRGSRHNV